MAEDGNKICILVLIGLPGSGKTYLTNFLINFFKNSNLNLKCNVLPFTYDELMPNLEASSCENMKDKRKEILNSVKNAIEKINLQNNSKSSKDGNNPLEPSKMSTLLVIDDNMYYRSMRYEYFKLSKLMRVGFCQIYLEASLEQSISVNSKRNISSQVTRNTILRMNNLIQIPNVKNNWEKPTIFIPFHCSLENSEVLQKILCLIKEASLTDLPEDGMKIKDKNSNINSLVHNVDLSFRWLIRNNITSFKRSGNEEIRSYANELNARKSKILKDLRAGSLLLPKSVVDALENQTSQNKELIHNFFHNILSNN